MFYEAFAFLLCPDHKKRLKYSVMWLNARQNSGEDWTMAKCLKKGLKFVDKLGIKVDLSEDGLRDAHAYSIRASVDSKTNEISHIQKNLIELESLKDHGLDYAKGTVLLCVHSMQFTHRTFVSDNVTVALDKLKATRSRSTLEQCLATTLRFFAIMEKLAARSASVSEKQAENARFEMKKFEANKGAQNVDGQESSEALPSIGGISILQDYKVVKDLERFISEWEQHLSQNIVKTFHLFLNF